MHRAIPITDHIHWVGANDRETQLFEGVWPLPRGVSYNAYAIRDAKTVLVDTVKKICFESYIDKVRQVLGDRPVDYLVVNHLEPDHSGSICLLRSLYPDLTIVGNRKTAEFLPALYGIPASAVRVVAAGEELSVGRHMLRFHPVPMVHWPESMVTYEASSKVLFSNDVFGGFGALDGGIFDDQVDTAFFRDEILRYFSNIVGRYAGLAQKAIAALGGLDIALIAPSHGPVWRSRPADIVGWYDRWSRQETEEGVVLAYGSMYGNTVRMMESVARGITQAGCSTVRLHDVARSHVSFLVADAWRYGALILGAPTYDGGLFPPMESVIRCLEGKRLKGRVLGLFGSYGWSGGAVKELRGFAERGEFSLVEPVVEARFAPAPDDVGACEQLGRNVVARMRRAGESA